MRRTWALAMTIGMAVVLGSSPAGWAQAQAPSEQDTTFMKAQQETNLAEISLGKVVMERAASADVRTLAGELVKGHEAVMQENMALSQRLGIEMPQAPNAKQQAMAEHVKSLSGAAFDKAYVDGQVEGHTTSVAAAEKEIATGAHPDVKAFATGYLPKAQNHLRMAQTLQTQLQAAGTGAETLPRTGSATGLLAVVGLGLALLGTLARLGTRTSGVR
jgi:putative membrane protein